jgi:light-harvesting complex 1 alpha chain
MHRIWLLFDPRLALVGLAVFLFGLAIVNHLVVFSSARYNIFEGAKVGPPKVENSALP